MTVSLSRPNAGGEGDSRKAVVTGQGKICQRKAADQNNAQYYDAVGDDSMRHETKRESNTEKGIGSTLRGKNYDKPGLRGVATAP